MIRGNKHHILLKGLIKIMPLCIVLLLFYACTPMRGTYCYSSYFMECIEFRKDDKFEYMRIIDVGKRMGSMGYGEYEITEDKVILNFQKPPVKDEATISVQKLEWNSKEETIGQKIDIVYNDPLNYIKIVSLDKQSKEIVKLGHVSFEYPNGIHMGSRQYFGRDTILFSINSIEFPLILNFNFMGYVNHEITLEEKSQYFILAELVSNEGYDIATGKKVFNREDFFSEKEAAQLLKSNPELPLQRRVFVKKK